MTKLYPDSQLLGQSAQEVILQLGISPDLHWFSGHFPDAPVLAGVVQLDWAIHYARQYFPDLAQPESIEVLKFQHIIRPEQRLRLQLQRTTIQTVLFNYSRDEVKLASGRIKWSLQHHG